MIELAHFGFLFALVLAGVVALVGSVDVRRVNVIQCSRVIFTMVTMSLLVLMYAFLTLDFSVSYVYQNAHAALPWYYRITAVWGAHEGSLLLFVWWMMLWQMVIARAQFKEKETQERAMIIMLWLFFMFASFIAYTSNPFTRIWPIPASSGLDLNPLLQDLGFVVHPPILYGGYTGSLLLFVVVLGWLWQHKKPLDHSALLRLLYPAFALLTLGIVLGSWWAYHVLGWGGVWFWDPVENVSLMPWLLLLMSIHHLHLKSQTKWHTWMMIIMAISMATLVVLGVFLVRSGVLVSVHSFATDPARGFYLLSMLCLIWLGSGALVWRSGLMAHKNGQKPYFWLLPPIILLGTLLSVVLLGTIAPIIAQAFGQSISIGAPYFNQMATPIVALAVIALVLQTVKPKNDWSTKDVVMLSSQMGVGVAVSLLFIWVYSLQSPIVFTVICVPIIVAMLRLNIDLRSGSSWSHFGFLLLLLSITVHSLGTQSFNRKLAEGEQDHIDGYKMTYVSDDATQDAYSRHKNVHFSFDYHQSFIGNMVSSIQWFDVRQMAMPRIGLMHHGLTDVYVALSQEIAPHEWVFRLAFHPWVRMIWFSGLLIVIGGGVSWNNRRKSY
ncbi:MAG: heme lyase CcmF/NrfE family subunit [Candidatus Comchoanobacterales bacterium]